MDANSTTARFAWNGLLSSFALDHTQEKTFVALLNILLHQRREGLLRKLIEQALRYHSDREKILALLRKDDATLARRSAAWRAWWILGHPVCPRYSTMEEGNHACLLQWK
uniref:Uncharacterized protein n=1 Tax=Arundo donax TaxID=35708 RepID=A0A0A9DK10_ARUDO